MTGASVNFGVNFLASAGLGLEAVGMLLFPCVLILAARVREPSVLPFLRQTRKRGTR